MQEMPVNYDRSEVQTRVANQRARVIQGFIGTGISVILLIAVLAYVQFARDGQADEVLGLLRAILIWSAALGVVLLGINIVWLTLLRGGLKRIGEGLAFVLSGQGIQHAQGELAWSEVARLVAAKGKAGQGYQLRIDGVDGSQVSFPLQGLAILPGTLDAATRAYSSGTHGIDLHALGA